MALALSLFGVAVSAASFAAATRDDRPAAEAPPARRVVHREVPAQFFIDPPSIVTPIPVDVLLSQLERHIRLERAVAESFLHQPTPESLHSRTVSPLVH